MKHFIAAVLDLDYDGITGISIENSEIMPDDINGKVSRFDINLSTNERNIIIEMQMIYVGYFQDRTLYYWSRKFGGQLISGESYSKLKRAEGLAEGEAKGIIQTYNELGKSFSDTVARIALMYNISEKDAKGKVEQYWH